MKAVAPGKLILSGEHSVVYGKPSVAMAIDRSVTATIEPGADGQVAFELPDISENDSFTMLALQDFKRRSLNNYRLFLEGELGIRDVLHKPVDLFKFAFITVLDGLHRSLDSGMVIKLKSNLPVGSGLGSSAASVLSELRALGHYLRVDFKPDWYYEFSLESEKLQHGHPSGVTLTSPSMADAPASKTAKQPPFHFRACRCFWSKPARPRRAPASASCR